MKYVMIDFSFPIVFPETFNHCDFKKIGKATSAGFVRLTEEGAVTYGKAESLKMIPDPEDPSILTKFIATLVF